MNAPFASKAGGLVATGLTKRFKTGRSHVTVLDRKSTRLNSSHI